MSVVTDYSALLSGSSWAGAGVSNRPVFLTYSFETAPVTYFVGPEYGGFLASFQPLSSGQMAVARDALQQWSAASGVTFFEVPAGQGDLKFGQYNLALDPDTTPGASGFGINPDVELTDTYAYIADYGGDIFIDLGQTDFLVFAHEVGHALGLKHPFEGTVTLDQSVDDLSHTVMTYNNAGLVTTLGSLDIAAVQHLYGPPSADGTQAASWSWNAPTYTLTQGGGPGADTLIGVGTSDVISSGVGRDYLVGSEGNDTLDGGADDDLLFAGAGADSLAGGDGDDELDSFGSGDTLNGGTGNDIIWTRGLANTVDGGSGHDVLAVLHYSSAGMAFSFADLLNGGGSITGVEEFVFFGDIGPDTLTGGSLLDDIAGDAGNDLLAGRDGGDTIWGQSGADTLQGEVGDDHLEGGAGDDRVFGGLGNDEILDRAGANYLRGDEGDDRIQGGDNFDDINGNMGDDIAWGGLGDDWVVGGKDQDVLMGEQGDDIVYGNLGNDTCDGGVGKDLIRGGQGDDSLVGGAGDDWVSGDRGSDTVSGGAGADTFHTFSGAGLDRVLDFSLAEGDRVQLDPGTTYTVRQSGGDTVIDMGGLDQMILVGVSSASLTGAWIFTL